MTSIPWGPGAARPGDIRGALSGPAREARERREAEAARRVRSLRGRRHPQSSRPDRAAASGFQAPGPGLRRHLLATGRMREPGGWGGDCAGGTELAPLR